MTHVTHASQQGDRAATFDDLVEIMRKAFTLLDEVVIELHEREEWWLDLLREGRDELEEGLSWAEEAKVPR